MPRADQARIANPSKFKNALLQKGSGGYLDLITADVPTSSDPVEVPIADLWLDDQPRLIVPADVLSDLIARKEARPAALLAALRTVAEERPYYRKVLVAIEDLARSIRADGVLNPLLIASVDGRHVVRDGHRRTLASLLAERQTVPVRVLDETSPIQATARQLVVNLQRSDLTALEQARWLFRLARLVEQELRPAGGRADDSSVVDALVGASPDEDAEDDASRGLPKSERDLAGAVQRRVSELTGLSGNYYYRLLKLNRLSPPAQAAGMELTEKQLRPVVVLPREDQGPIVEFIASRNLTSREAATLVEVARSGDRDAVRRVMAKLAREDAGRQRASVSWESLMHAVPKDVDARCAALHAELVALPSELRVVRLRSIHEQQRLATELARQFAEIIELYRDELVEPG